MKSLSKSKIASLARNDGFTLIEIIIVVAIIGSIMAGVMVTIQGQMQKAKVGQAGLKISETMQALNQYYNDAGQYPTTDQGLEALVEKPTSEPVPRRYDPAGYMKKFPLDPWDSELEYTREQANKYTIISMGPDQMLETEDDISSESLDD